VYRVAERHLRVTYVKWSVSIEISLIHQPNLQHQHQHQHQHTDTQHTQSLLATLDPTKGHRSLVRQRAAQRESDEAQRAAAEAKARLAVLADERAELEADNRRLATAVARLQAAYAAATGSAVRQAAASLELEKDMAELTSLASAAGEVRAHAEMAQEELHLLTEALGGHLTRAEKRAAAAGEAAAIAAAGAGSSLIADANAILAQSEQLISASEQQAAGSSTAEKLLWVNRTAESLRPAAAEPAPSAQRKEFPAPAAANPSGVLSVFGVPPQMPQMQEFLSDLIRRTEQQAAGAKAGAGGAAAAADTAKAGSSDQVSGRASKAAEPIALWLRHWSAAPGWDAKAAWLSNWARSQLAEGRQHAKAAAAGSQMVFHLKEKVLAACTLVVGLTDNLWPDEQDGGKEGGGAGADKGAAKAADEPRAQTEYGPDGGGMDRTGGGDDGGAGKGKGGSGGGGGDAGDGGFLGGGGSKPPGGSGGNGNGNGASDPFDGFENFPPSGGMDPAILLPVAFAAAVSLAAGLMNASKRAAGASSATSRAASPAVGSGEATAQPGPKQRRREEAKEPSGAAASAAGGRSAAYDATRAEPLSAARRFAAAGMDVLVAADEAAHLEDTAVERLRRQMADSTKEVPVLAAGALAAADGGEAAPGLLVDLHPTRLQNLTWVQLDELPAKAQCEVLALRGEAQRGRCERRALKRYLRHLERAGEESEAELEAERARVKGLQTALEAAVAQVRLLVMIDGQQPRHELCTTATALYFAACFATILDQTTDTIPRLINNQHHHITKPPGFRHRRRCSCHRPRHGCSSCPGFFQGGQQRQLRAAARQEEAAAGERRRPARGQPHRGAPGSAGGAAVGGRLAHLGPRGPPGARRRAARRRRVPDGTRAGGGARPGGHLGDAGVAAEEPAGARAQRGGRRARARRRGSARGRRVERAGGCPGRGPHCRTRCVRRQRAVPGVPPGRAGLRARARLGRRGRAAAAPGRRQGRRQGELGGPGRGARGGQRGGGGG
jgi:hypothetical protein